MQLLNLSFTVVPIIFLFFFSILATETPLYLMQQGDEITARKTLKKLNFHDEAIDTYIAELYCMIQEQDGGKWIKIFRYV